MRSPSKNDALSERLRKSVDKIINGDSRGAIDGVQFDLRHKGLDPNEWSILCLIEDVMYLPNEFDQGRLFNQQGIWYPWFGEFSANALRSKVSKLKPEAAARLLKNIEAEAGAAASDQKPADRLVQLLTPAYFVERGDTISVDSVVDSAVGGDHLHAHDRLIKRSSIQISKSDGTLINIERPYDVFGNHTIVNPREETSDSFGSILFRIVRHHNLKGPSQLKRFKRYDSDISTASAIAYDLHKMVEHAFYDGEGKDAPSEEAIAEAEIDLEIVSEATLLGYLWAKIEFEANLKPLADFGKRRRSDSSRGGKASVLERRQKAENGWIPIAKKMAQKLREQKPGLSQDKLAEEIGFAWTSDLKQPGHARLKKFISDMEKSGELLPRQPPSRGE